MDCPVCWALRRAYESAASEYLEAGSSACFHMCMNVAAQKNVEMERARYEFDEYRRVCFSAPKRSVSITLKKFVA